MQQCLISKYIATIGVDYGVKRCKVDGADVRINFWDIYLVMPDFLKFEKNSTKTLRAAYLYSTFLHENHLMNVCDAWLSECAKYT